jgi:hypothetical protein
VLGLVFTVPDSNQVGSLELRDEKVKGGDGSREGERRCVEQAVRNVEVGKQVEGVLDIEGRGKMGFLVYRVD